MLDSALRFYKSLTLNPNGRPVLQYTYLAAGMLCVLLCSGIIYGWSSLLLVFQAEGVYSELCTNSTASAASNSYLSYTASALHTAMSSEGPVDTSKMCSAQILRFELVYILGLVSVFLSTPVHGFLLDTYGARFLNHTASVFVIIGSLFFAFGYNTAKLDLLIPAMICIAFGGMATLLSLFPFAKITPQYISIVLAFYNVGFDSSPLVFYIYVKVYQATGLSPRSFFLIYLIVPISMLILSVFWPKGIGEPHGTSEEQKETNTQSAGELELDTISEGDARVVPLEGDSNGSLEALESNRESKTPETEEPTSELGPVEQFAWPFKKQLLSIESVLICLTHIIFSSWLSVYMGSVQSRLKALEPTGNMERIDAYTEHFGLVLSLAFLSAPLVGFSIYKLKVLRAFFVCILMSIVWNLGQFLPFTAQIFTFVVFAVVRAWYYGIIFTFITHVFSWVNVGKLWGVFNLFAGLVSFAFYGISWAVVHWFKGSYTIPNIVSTISFSSTLLIALYFKRRHDVYVSAQQQKTASSP